MLDSLSLIPIRKSHDSYAFHKTPDGIAEEFTSWLECSIDSDVVIWSHEEIARLWRVMRCLFGYVIASRLVRVVPVGCERFPKDGIEWLLDTSSKSSVGPFYSLMISSTLHTVVSCASH